MTQLTIQNKGQVLFYQTDDHQVRFDVIFENETVWLSQDQMSELFDRDQSVISRHIKNTYEEWELEEKSTMQKMHIANSDKPVAFYNLDVIISVGYRVKSFRWTKFRIRATHKLKEYILKGFVLDDDRLAEGRTANQYYDELIERIRKIRTSERNFYQKITDIFTTSIDYNKSSELTKSFFATVQNKMHFGIHGHTAAEVIAGRVDHQKPFMGLTNRKWWEIQKKDVVWFFQDDPISLFHLVSRSHQVW